jgi:hypothetical protein
MHGIFYANTVNIPMAFIHHRIIHVGLKIFIMHNDMIFIFFSGCTTNVEK